MEFNFEQAELNEEQQKQFFETFEKVTGVKPDEFQSKYIPAEKYSELEQTFESTQAKVGEFQQKLSKYDIEDPFHKRMLDMVTGGATKEDVQNFIRLQSLDLNNMSDRDLLIEHYISEGANRSDAERLASRDLRMAKNEDGDVDDEKMAEIRLMTNKIKNSLRNQIVSSENPESMQKVSKAQQAREQLYSSYKSEVPKMVGQLSKVTIDPKVEGVEGLQVDVPGNVLAAIEQGAIQFGVNQNIPLDHPAIQQHINNSLYYFYGNEIIESVIKQLDEKYAAKYGNPTPPPSGGQPGSQALTSDQEFEKWKKENIARGEL